MSKKIFLRALKGPDRREVERLRKLPEADPFLEPNKEFVFVARFDGAKPGSEPNSVMASLTILAYYLPSALLLE